VAELSAGLTAEQVLAIGITNQRETTLVWDAQSGEPIYPAIVWQDRRTADYCAELKESGHEALINARTGLLIDPYFSASKLRWILRNVPAAQARAERGELRFGTVDCFLLWRLSGGQVHRTDASNASRTCLFDIHRQCWDEELLALFEIPASLLPEVLDCAADFGECQAQWLGASIPVLGMAGDQQAALIGQGCFQPGMIKSTYGTGCFMIQNTGDTPVRSRHRLLTTVAYRLQGQVTYAVEGSIFVAGAAMQWLRDGVKLIRHAEDSEALAEQTGEACGVYLVPAFTGLGAPYWDPKARGAIFGLTRDTGIKEIVTAGLQSVCYQSRDLLDAMAQDGAAAPATLRVDGGMVGNGWLMQFLADILGVPVERPQMTETTALGAAFLAGLQAGLFRDTAQIAGHWQLQQRFTPRMSEAQRQPLYAGWLDAVQRVRTQD
jgi:glycerol kinase